MSRGLPPNGHHRETQLRRIHLGVVGALLLALIATIGVGCRSSEPRKATTRQHTFVAKDLPTNPGVSREYVTNDPKLNRFIPVEFDFSGPWDFTEGPIDALVVAKTTRAGAGPNSAKFPKATFAISRLIKGQEKYEITGYFAKTDKAYLNYGQADKKSTDVLPKPESMLEFPLKVGVGWTQEIVSRTKPPTRMKIKRKIVGQGLIVVPAGEFKDTVMVQIKKTVTESDGTSTSGIGYEWYAPGVGAVAAIAGRNDEPEPLFKEAAFFQRLKAYTK